MLRLVRVVRNNLFHGGKYQSGPFDEIARNENLLEAAITVLSHCLALSDPVREAFEEVL